MFCGSCLPCQISQRRSLRSTSPFLEAKRQRRRDQVSEIVKITDYKSRETMDVLKLLMEQVCVGDLRGIVFVARLGPKHHGMGMTGEYHRDPLLGLAAVARVTYRLNRLAEHREADNWIVGNQ